MKQFEYINAKMKEVAALPETVFVGYSLKYGSRAYGTMAGVPEDKIIEMPTAEALMTGIATGMALTGMVPILYFERHDFLLLASDQIVNHLAKIDQLSHGDFNPKVIIRAVVGHDKPFDPGPQHMGNYTKLFWRHLTLVDTRKTPVPYSYHVAMGATGPIMIVEYKEDYSKEVGE